MPACWTCLHQRLGGIYPFGRCAHPGMPLDPTASIINAWRVDNGCEKHQPKPPAAAPSRSKPQGGKNVHLSS